MVKNVLKEYIPYKYMRERREKQHIEILKKQSEPELYTEDGERKRVFYLKDTLCQHTPYTLVLGQVPNSVFWDRNNVGLPIHFYSHEQIFNVKNNYCQKKFALLFESEVIKNEDFCRVEKEKEWMSEFDAIFTFSSRILDKYDNAYFVPASGLWYGTKINGGELDANAWKKKTNNISVVASNKQSSYYHKLRIELANKALKSGKVDGYGAFCGNYIEKKAEALAPYRFSLVVENDVKPYYFTEKILDCFASMTIPIYVGASKIAEFFDEAGIICLKENEYNNLENVLSMCTEQFYMERIDAVINNFSKVSKYRCIEDYMMNEYNTLFEL